MGHDWIVDVLADLKRYAQKHHLDDLDASLEMAINVAKDAETSAEEKSGRDVPRAQDSFRRVAERTGSR